MWINTIFTVPRNLLVVNVSTAYKNAGLRACKSSMFKGWDNKFCSALQAMCKEYIWPPYDEKMNPAQAAVSIKNEGHIYLYQFDTKKGNVTADSRPKQLLPECKNRLNSQPCIEQRGPPILRISPKTGSY